MAKHPFTPDFQHLPDTLPIFPLPGAIVLPFTQLPLNIFEPRYLNMVLDALGEARMIGMIQPHLSTPETLYQTGCAGRITMFRETEDGRLLISLTGICRFDLQEEIASLRGYRRIIPAWGRFTRDYFESETQVDVRELIAALEVFLQVNNLEADMNRLQAMPGPQLVNFLAVNLPFEPADKQALVEATDIAERAKILTTLTEIAAAAQQDPTPWHH